MFPRNIRRPFLSALSDTPVVFLAGARQVGKSTFVQAVTGQSHPARYLTLDDATILAAARSDPAAFLGGFEGPLVIDEVQRAPDLFLAIKSEVDRGRRPGRFILTGSANVLLLPRLAETLAGRMEVIPLWPLSQGEMEAVEEGFLDALYKETLPGIPDGADGRREVLARVVRGGYPEAVSRAEMGRRAAWFGSYITTILQRDVRDLARVEGLAEMPRLLALAAARATSLLNYSELARSGAMPQSTLKRYLALFETTFLVQTLPAWSSNLGKRLIRSPKIMLNDTGLMAYLMGIDEARLEADGDLVGPLLENFVFMELRKQAAWNRVRPALFHFRTAGGQEVDLLLEDRAGRIVGIEVRAASTVGAGDFRGLRALEESAGKRFHRGVVLYTGNTALSFGRRLHALPVSALWRLDARPAGRAA